MWRGGADPHSLFCMEKRFLITWPYSLTRHLVQRKSSPVTILKICILPFYLQEQMLKEANKIDSKMNKTIVQEKKGKNKSEAITF